MVDAATAAMSERPRSAVRLMLDPSFGGLFWGKLITAAGAWAHTVIAAVVVYDITGSALWVGLVSGAQFLPQIVLGPWSGALADGGRIRDQIAVGRILCVVGSAAAALGTALVDRGGTAVIVVILCSSLVVGLGFVVGGPAMQAVVPDMVRRSELSTAMAMNTAPSAVASVAGPTAGAALLASVGPAWGFAVAAGTHMAMLLLVLLVIRFPERSTADGVERDRSVMAAVRHVASDASLSGLLLVIAAAVIGAAPALTLAPPMAVRLGRGADAVGLISAAFGVGSLIGLGVAPALSRVFSQRRTAALGLAGLVVGLALAPWWTALWAVSLGLAVAGFGHAVAITSATTMIQLVVPAELRGRVMALWLIAYIGARPLGGALVGTATDAWDVRLGYLVAALIVAAGAVPLARVTTRVGGPSRTRPNQV